MKKKPLKFLKYIPCQNKSNLNYNNRQTYANVFFLISAFDFFWGDIKYRKIYDFIKIRIYIYINIYKYIYIMYILYINIYIYYTYYIDIFYVYIYNPSKNEYIYEVS